MRLTEERWAPVVGYKGKYEVSTLGRVRSLMWREPRIMTGSLMLNGYRGVMLNTQPPPNRLKRINILVYEAFVGPRPQGMHVCHIDGDRLNNALTNLRLDTPAGNARDKIAHGTHNAGEKNSHSKLTWEQVDVIKQRLAAGEKCVTIAMDNGVTPQAISKIKHGKNWVKRYDLDSLEADNAVA